MTGIKLGIIISKSKLHEARRSRVLLANWRSSLRFIGNGGSGCTQSGYCKGASSLTLALCSLIGSKFCLLNNKISYRSLNESARGLLAYSLSSLFNLFSFCQTSVRKSRKRWITSCKSRVWSPRVLCIPRRVSSCRWMALSSLSTVFQSSAVSAWGNISPTSPSCWVKVCSLWWFGNWIGPLWCRLLKVKSICQQSMTNRGTISGHDELLHLHTTCVLLAAWVL